MKLIIALLCIAVASKSVTSLTAAGTETNAAPSSPFAPIEFLVGGTWHGVLPPDPEGRKVVIESKYEWTGNHQGIRFESAWLMGDKKYPYCSGVYVWNPEQQQLAIVYSDAKGALTEGFVELVGRVCQHNLKVIDKSGKAERIQARMTHPDARSYVNEIHTMKDGQWQKLVSVRYERSE